MTNLDLDTVTLANGSHDSPDAGMCVMEAVAFVAGEPFSDHPQCASKVLGDFLRAWNDAMSEEDRQQLKPFIPRLVGTAASPEIEEQRQWMLLDWWCRVSAPTWLRLAKLEVEAVAVESTPPIVDKATASAAIKALASAASAARAAWAAAWDAAWAAARDAAWDAAGAAAWAAAWDAARDAAWAAAGAAAWAAAWDAAWDAAWAAAGAAAWAAARDAAWAAAGAAARDAARAAAWAAAGDALRPTVVALQASALELLDRMIALSEEAA